MGLLECLHEGGDARRAAQGGRETTEAGTLRRALLEAGPEAAQYPRGALRPLLGRHERPGERTGQEGARHPRERSARLCRFRRPAPGAPQCARTDQESLPSPLAVLVLSRAEGNLEHPAAAWLLTWVCNNYGDGEWPEEPRTFAEAANLIAARFPDSPDIFNFCECLVERRGKCRPWALKYERHLRTILTRNRNRWVRCTALFSLAAVVNGAGEARRDEAESSTNPSSSNSATCPTPGRRMWKSWCSKRPGASSRRSGIGRRNARQRSPGRRSQSGYLMREALYLSKRSECEPVSPRISLPLSFL